jgi:uncharacterized protein YdiU (UPF0061 family)
VANLTMDTTYEPTSPVAAFPFDNSFARELEGFYVSRRPAVARAPRLLFLNDSLVEELGLDLWPLGQTPKNDLVVRP